MEKQIITITYVNLLNIRATYIKFILHDEKVGP